MKKSIIALALLLSIASQAQYRTLWIPDTLTGTNFSLVAKDTFKQMLTGNQTITHAYNGDFWGPTMIWNDGQVVNINVINKLQDTTTVHWHGMHLPAIMDGGPHQMIAPNTTWSPYWKVKANAGFYWYHPHLHMEAENQINSGLGGLIIVRDTIESKLALPRTYGIDDIPLALTDRTFSNSNQMTIVPYGDTMVVNGTVNPQYTIPAQVVRLRLLNAAIERSYNIGFSDNRTFYVITTDGGLLNAPVPLTRFLLSAGERVEILINCTGQANSSVELMSYNSTLAQQIPGGDLLPGNTPFRNNLARRNFNMLHLNIGAATTNAITSIPTALVTNTYLNAANANLTRQLTLTDSPATSVGGVAILGPNAFIINHKAFVLDTINYHVPLNNTEIWQITSTSGFGHPFHIHDAEFNILSINGSAPPAEQQGWKDVVLVKSRETVKFIIKFDDYSDALHPYMYHCHIALHEDEGMMGQFVVGNSPAGIMDVAQNSKLKIYPNPASTILHFEMAENIIATSGTIADVNGKIVMNINPNSDRGNIDVASIESGVYFLRLVDASGNSYIKEYVRQ